jgi:hypothetical protein
LPDYLILQQFFVWETMNWGIFEKEMTPCGISAMVIGGVRLHPVHRVADRESSR